MVWEVTIIKFQDGRYKVIRRLPEYYISETKLFTNREEAIRQFDEWLR